MKRKAHAQDKTFELLDREEHRSITVGTAVEEFGGLLAFPFIQQAMRKPILPEEPVSG